MARVSNEQASRNRQAVVEGASRLLRKKGLEGVGIRELMAAAGLTQGAFSRQFSSKEALAAEACTHAFEGAQRAFVASTHGDQPGQAGRLVDDYFRPRPTGQECPMATLAIDAARTSNDSPFRSAFGEGLERLSHVVAGDPPAPDRLVLLAAMVGASILSQAGKSGKLGEQIKAAVAIFSKTID